MNTLEDIIRIKLNEKNLSNEACKQILEILYEMTIDTHNIKLENVDKILVEQAYQKLIDYLSAKKRFNEFIEKEKKESGIDFRRLTTIKDELPEPFNFGERKRKKTKRRKKRRRKSKRN